MSLNRVHIAQPALLLMLAIGAFFAGCTKTGHVTPTPTGVPSGPQTTFTPRTSQSPGILSQFTVSSIPAGLGVQLNGASQGNTTVTLTPNYNNDVYTISIQPTNGNPLYNYLFNQTANGNKTVLYNQPFDTTNGSIASVTQSIYGRAKHKRASVVGRPHFSAATWLGRPQFSTTRLSVRYDMTALRSAVRRPQDLERLEGVERAVDIGFERGGQATRILNVPAGHSIDEMVNRMRGHREVRDARPLGLRYVSSSTALLPNDTDFSDTTQWDMFSTQMPNAWGYTTGNASVAIAMIDTGADNNQTDLAGGKMTFGEKVLNGTITSGLAASQDTDGHGTNTAGIAAADTNNGAGVAGTGWNTSLQIYKIFGDGPNQQADTGDEAQAIYDAIAQHARVINLSLGGSQGGGFDPVERDAIEYALSQGVVVVAAAGNERSATDPNPGVDFPAAYDGVIAVGATSLNDNNSGNPVGATEYVASYSNVGPQLSVVAPGGDPSSSNDTDPLHWIENLYTTTPFDPSQSCSDKNDCLALYAGTSQASPHVSGIAALMIAANGGLSPAHIKEMIQSTADDIHDPNQGFGRVDGYRAVAAAIGDTHGLPKPGFTNFVAFAYDNSGGTTPHIVNVTYPKGIPVAADGTFRIADVPANLGPFHVAVWADVNGDGVVDAGDYFAATATTCTSNAPCPAAHGLVAQQVASGFHLP